MQHSVSIVNMNQYGSNRTYCELACTGVMCAGMCIMSAIYSRLLVTLEASAKCNTIANATTFSSHRAARGTAQQGEVQNVETKNLQGQGQGQGQMARRDSPCREGPWQQHPCREAACWLPAFLRTLLLLRLLLRVRRRMAVVLFPTASLPTQTKLI